MKNKIIIEGFWNTGKSTLASYINKNWGHNIINEPVFTKNDIISDIDDWYIKNHLKNQKYFFQNQKEKIVMERSILSSGAFLYTIRKENKNFVKEKLSKFKILSNKEKPLLIFLYAPESFLINRCANIKDEKLKKLLNQKDFIKRYDNFFRNILPFFYDITPLFINIIDDKNKIKPVEIIANNIIFALEKNRIAQINIACYKKDEKNKLLFLLLKRNFKKGNFWQTVSGGVKQNNTLTETLCIELFEELGLVAEKKRFLNINYNFNYIGSEGYELNEYAFGYELLKDEKIFLSGEHTEYKFVNLEKADSLLKYQDNKNIVKLISDILVKK